MAQLLASSPLEGPSGIDTIGKEITAADVAKLLAAFCERDGSQLGGIVEEDEDEEEEFGGMEGSKKATMEEGNAAPNSGYLEFAQFAGRLTESIGEA
jgi:hypothetical protein